jgi:membrane carboxypeptidase/penicillin-binding protein
VWIDIMREYLDGRDREHPPEFEAPANIVFVPVDRHTGQPVDENDPDAISEAFISGTQPSR